MRFLPVLGDSAVTLDATAPRVDSVGAERPRRLEANVGERSIFRDPPPVASDAARLELLIARTLVGASALPIELKAFGLRLLAVEVDARGIDLVIGLSAPIAPSP